MNCAERKSIWWFGTFRLPEHVNMLQYTVVADTVSARSITTITTNTTTTITVSTITTTTTTTTTTTITTTTSISSSG
jgi:hypothetical protein